LSKDNVDLPKVGY